MKKHLLFIFTGILVTCGLNSLAQNNRVWATYYGGPAIDESCFVTTDILGNIYLLGSTKSTTGIAYNGFQDTISGTHNNAFIVKFDTDGNRLWATYYGGIGYQGGSSIATDSWGNVYLAGSTTSISGIASGGFRDTLSGMQDAFLVKFNASGNRLWATYYGGTGSDYGTSVATDKLGNVYLAGYTGATSDIASGGFQNTLGGNSDAFLVKFDSTGNRLWASYYGGANNDLMVSVATDSKGNVYLAGNTGSTSGIASGGFQNTNNGNWDTFVAKFNSSGNRLWGTYYGGNNEDYCNGIATDNFENVYLTGITKSTSDIASGGFQNIFGGGNRDGFLVKFNSNGARRWATYYGGPGDDFNMSGSVATDLSGNVYIGGDTYSATNIASGGFQDSLIGAENQFVVKFDSSGNRLCATYYGYAILSDCELGKIAVDRFDNIYLTAITKDTINIAFGGFQNTLSGEYDAYLVKLTSCFSTYSINEFDDFDKNNITLFPNPTNNKLTIEKTAISPNAIISIFNIQGDLLLQQLTEQTKTVIDISMLAKGMYFVKVIMGSETEVKKFIKD